EPDPGKVQALAPFLKLLDQQNVPHYIFINKVDKGTGPVRALADSLNKISEHPVVMRHLPIRDGETVTGYIDLAQQRAYVYEAQKPSKTIDMPSDDPRLEEARFSLMETLADFDDHLMEELLEDIVPPKKEIFEDLAKDASSNLVVSALIGSAINDHGVFRLLKALRHEIPGIEATCKRRGISPEGGLLGQSLKSIHTEHGGKRTIARIFRGALKDGETISGERISGITYMHGEDGVKRPEAKAGELVALGRLDNIKTGDTLGNEESLERAEALFPVYEMAISAEHRNDEMKLSESLVKICDEDPSITFEHREATHEMVFKGQGEVHIKTAINRLKSRYHIEVNMAKPKIPYQETIQKPASQHTRFKKQSGGHGQFGDVVVEVRPLPRGEGFVFEEKIRGGNIPKQYIPSVETGIKGYLKKGPLGFPVVDFKVVLVDGKYHAVDSSDMAFQTAGRMAMSESLPKCSPVLLEPIMHVHIHVPNDYTNKVTGMISQRRGQMLGYDAREGWPGWDTVEAHMPQSEIHDLIIELRSMSQGAATYTHEFHHMQELTGRLAEQVLKEHKKD
ncbi:MAG: elongation factor G, partial [Proteobacteria bacterium]|nr:elongation factor G [Pseudomonadota bacterium]